MGNAKIDEALRTLLDCIGGAQGWTFEVGTAGKLEAVVIVHRIGWTVEQSAKESPDAIQETQP